MIGLSRRDWKLVLGKAFQDDGLDTWAWNWGICDNSDVIEDHVYFA